jgi:hypothetical protein
VDAGWVRATTDEISIGDGAQTVIRWDLWWFNRDLGEDSEDHFRCEVSGDGGFTWALLDALSSDSPLHPWSTREFSLPTALHGATAIRLRFTASDGPASGNLIEAAIDNLTVISPSASVPATLTGFGFH